MHFWFVHSCVQFVEITYWAAAENCNFNSNAKALEQNNATARECKGGREEGWESTRVRGCKLGRVQEWKGTRVEGFKH